MSFVSILACKNALANASAGKIRPIYARKNVYAGKQRWKHEIVLAANKGRSPGWASIYSNRRGEKQRRERCGTGVWGRRYIDFHGERTKSCDNKSQKERENDCLCEYTVLPVRFPRWRCCGSNNAFDFFFFRLRFDFRISALQSEMRPSVRPEKTRLACPKIFPSRKAVVIEMSGREPARHGVPDNTREI